MQEPFLCFLVVECLCEEVHDCGVPLSGVPCDG
jgi:hypothetical protein